MSLQVKQLKQNFEGFRNSSIQNTPDLPTLQSLNKV